MSEVTIVKVRQSGEQSASFFDEMQGLADRVRERAFELFERRGASHGSDMDDWLQAERELTWSPESELIEREGTLELRIAVPGFTTHDVRVTAQPQGILIHASVTHQRSQREGGVRVSEVGLHSVFRRFDLPVPIEVDRIAAILDSGVLTLTAPKLQAAPAGSTSF